ncbi:MAG: hypothetical protein J6T47_10615 [Lachnospiraceae bacterium]|nr:hypothetical protein [Lachnospiraceae bacterium]
MKKRINLSLFCIILLITGLLGSTLAFAGTGTAGGAIPVPTVEDTTNAINTVSIRKDLIFVNDAASDVREPNITYTYTASAVTVSGTAPTVTTNDAGPAAVKSGVPDALTNTTDTIVFADTAVASSSADGVAATRYANFTFDPTKFAGPGIYRYMVVESTDKQKTTLGIVAAATYSDTRYLDVYVRKTSETDPTLLIYGYTLFKADATYSFSSKTGEVLNLDKKSSGYVNISTTAGSFEDVDVYRTQDLTVSKTTTGLLADKSNNFPVAITVTLPSAVTQTIKLDVALESNATLDGTTTDTIGSYVNSQATAYNGSVENDSKIKIKGVPYGATVVLVEQNNTPDTYKVSATASVGSAAATEVLAEESVAAGTNSSSTTATVMTSNTTIAITNKLELISPTGYVARFAPYALILAGGILLIVFGRTAISRTSKKRKEA